MKCLSEINYQRKKEEIIGYGYSLHGIDKIDMSWNIPILGKEGWMLRWDREMEDLNL